MFVILDIMLMVENVWHVFRIVIVVIVSLTVLGVIWDMDLMLVG